MQIPNWFAGESPGSTKVNPFPLPDAYMASQNRNVFYLNILFSVWLEIYIQYLDYIYKWY